MIKIPQPSISLNSHDVPGAKYEMWENRNIPANTKVTAFLATAAALAAGSGDNGVKCLVINCHGDYGKGAGKVISTGGFGFSIGEGIDLTTAQSFSQLRGLVQCIIIVACGAAYVTNPNQHGDGGLLCSTIAQAANAYVIAPKTYQIERLIKLPKNHIDNFEGVVVRYNPSGVLEDSSVLGRKLIRDVVSE